MITSRLRPAPVTLVAAFALTVLAVFAWGAKGADAESAVSKGLAERIPSEGVVEVQSVDKVGQVDVASVVSEGSDGRCYDVIAVPESGVGGGSIGGCSDSEEPIRRTWGFGSLATDGQGLSVFSGSAPPEEVATVRISFVDGEAFTASVSQAGMWGVTVPGVIDESGADIETIEFLGVDGSTVELVDVQEALNEGRSGRDTTYP